jgi:multiple sugar transport system permease protein
VNRHLPSLLVHVLLVVGALVTLTPLLWMVSASFMPTGQASSFPPPLLPSAPTLQHYSDLFTRLNLARNFANSLLITLGVTLFSLFVNSMAGYAFAKLRFTGRDATFKVLVAAMVIPGQVGMMPLFLIVKSLGLVNTPWGVMVTGLATVFGIFMIRQFALSIPDDLLDAARIDGASEWRIYWTIVLPVLQPILVTMATFSFLSSWNDFMWPLIVLSDSSKYTLPVALANLVGEHVQDTELMMAGSVLTILPVLMVFLVMQRSYIKGVLMGSVKG